MATATTKSGKYTLLRAEDRANRTYKRQCGNCTLCCTLVKVDTEELQKPPNQKCPHECGKCGIYPTRPIACKAFACIWLADPGVTRNWKRPDLTHFVVDEAADIAMINGIQVPCLQVYMDPKYPEAWKTNKDLRKLMLKLAQHGTITMVRNGDIYGIGVLAPPMSPSGRWEYHQYYFPKGSKATTPEQKKEFFQGIGLSAPPRTTDNE